MRMSKIEQGGAQVFAGVLTGNTQDRGVIHFVADGALNLLVGVVIERSRRFVKNQDRRRGKLEFKHSARQSEKLTLAWCFHRKGQGSARGPGTHRQDIVPAEKFFPPSLTSIVRLLTTNRSSVSSTVTVPSSSEPASLGSREGAGVLRVGEAIWTRRRTSQSALSSY